MHRRDLHRLINYLWARRVNFREASQESDRERKRKKGMEGEVREHSRPTRSTVCNQKKSPKRKRDEAERRSETRKNVERATNEVVQSSYQRLATKRSISSNRRGRNYPYNSYYWVPRHVKIENERRVDEIDIHGTSAVVESFLVI